MNEPGGVTTEPPIRRHDLDAVRAFAMLLGLVLHCAMPFVGLPIPAQDAQTSEGLAFAFWTIHGFRMPAFFLLSGFFTAMLWQRRGLGGLIKHRTKRIVLPMSIGLATVVPLTWASLLIHEPNPPPPPPPGELVDLWTACGEGETDAVRIHIADGADVNEQDPTFGTTPLGYAALGGHPEIVQALLEAGADPSGRYRDQNTPMHTACFFGRDEVAMLLLDAGADVEALNTQGETPPMTMRHDEGVTMFIANILTMEIDFAEVKAGRDRIGERLGRPPEPETSGWKKLLWGLRDFPLFHHLWFLWFLCWMVAGFAVAVSVGRPLLRVPWPRVLLMPPVSLLWLVPATWFFFRSTGVGLAFFGPDTSAGMLPIPHVLGMYGLFFGYGAVLFGASSTALRIGRWWIAYLLAAGLMLVPALAFSFEDPWAQGLVPDADQRRMIADAGESLFPWLMTFGLMGLGESLLSRGRGWVRYLSDSSYWLYLAHLPLMYSGFALIADWAAPALLKFSVLLAMVTGVSLATYALFVRHTFIGTMLNGKRVRAKITPPAQAIEQAS